jgi:hypothetical protein
MPSNELGDLIGRYEGGPHDPYNISNDGTGHGSHHDFSNMTIAEILRQQERYLADNYDHRYYPNLHHLNAVGKYQIMPKTMADLVTKYGIDPQLKFTPETQEMIFADYSLAKIRKEVKHYIEGRPSATLLAAQNAIAAEWRCVERPGGHGMEWSGQHPAKISADQIGDTLDAMRAEYQQAIHNGAAPENAWREVTGRAPVLEKTYQQERQQSHSRQPPASGPSAALTPADPGHPDHALNEGIRQKAQALFASENVTLTDRQLDNLTAALMVDARANGVTRAYCAEFSDGGCQAPDANIIIADGDPEKLETTNECAVTIQQAMNVPAEQSYQQFEQIKQQQLTYTQEFVQRQEVERQMGMGLSR